MINWNMGLAPDVGGMFMRGLEAGHERRRQDAERAKQEAGQNAMADYARNPNEQSLNGLADYNPEFVVQQKRQQAGAQDEATARGMKMIGEAARWADTPEKWDAAIDHLTQFSPEIAQYKGRFSPDLRMAAITAAGQYGAFQNQTTPVNMAPGNRLVDPRDGRTIAEAPFAPRQVTVSEGQTAVEYTPGGGGLSNGIVQALQSRGYSPSQARGIAAGIHAESRGDPNIVNPTSGAYGLGQWLGSRKEELFRRYGGKPTMEQQLEFLDWELKGGDHGGSAVLGAGDEQGVLNAYITKFMRPDAGAETTGDLQRGMAALGGGGGSRVIAQGGAKPTYRTLSAQEAQQQGLPAGVWQQGPNGEIKPVSGATGKNAAEKPEAYSQSAIDAFNRAMATAGRLLHHPGLSAAVGMKGLAGGLLGGWVVPGTDAADFRAEVDAMKAQVFLPMVQSMKGMGALSNAEGQKLTDSIGTLDPNMSERAFKASLGRIILDLKTYRDRASQSPSAGAVNRPRASAFKFLGFE